MKPAAAAAFALALGANARAESVALERWEPGNRTASTVRGEVGDPESRPGADGVYGRFEGDLDLGLGAGAELDHDGTRGALRGSLHYFSMIGVYTGYSDALGRRDAAYERAISVGVDLRPAFIPRWSRDLEHGPGVLDLAIDSLSLGLGAFWAKPSGGALGDARGFELSGGLGLALLGVADGPWLEARGLLRWPDPGRASGRDADAAGLLVLTWHALVGTPLANREE